MTTPTSQNNNVEIISSNAILTTHYFFNSFPKELIDNDVLKIAHLDCFHTDDQVVQSSLELLKSIGTEKSYQYLFSIIKDYPNERKIWALKTLYHIGNNDIISPLLDYFKTSLNEDVKSDIIRILAHFGKENKEVNNLILAHSKDEFQGTSLHYAAIDALADIQDVATLQNMVEHSDEETQIAGIKSLGKIKNIDSRHLIKRLCTQFKSYSIQLKLALIQALLNSENEYVLELIKIIFQEGNEEHIKDVLELIEGNEFLKTYPIRLTKLFLRMPELSEGLEEKVITTFTSYYESFSELSSKITKDISESIESNLRSYFAKFKANYQKEYSTNLNLKTKIDKKLFLAKEYLEKFADESFVQSLSNHLKTENFSESNKQYIKLSDQINNTAAKIKGDYSRNVKALLTLLKSTDKLERTRVAVFLNIVNFKKKHHINRLHKLLSFVSITKNNKYMDISYELYRWALQFQENKLLQTAIMALGRSGHKILIKEAEKTLFPMQDKKISLITLIGLGELGHKDSIPVITGYFKTLEYDEDLYLYTTDALRKINHKNDRSILETLLKIFITAPSDNVKYNAGMTFASLASDQMIPSLIKYKDSKVDKIRELLPLMVDKLHGLNRENGKEMMQNFYYSMLKDATLYVQINSILGLYRMGDTYSIEVLKDLFKTPDLKILSDTIVKTVEVDSLDKIYWLVKLLKHENEEIQRSISLALVSLLEGESKHKKTIADLIKDFRLKPYVDKQIDQIDSIKETQLDLTRIQEKEKFKFERENTKEMTILFIDITGYTKKSSSMELMEIMDYLNTYEEMALPIFKNHYGTVVKKMGDGLMLSFPLAVYAALAGIRLQEKLYNFNLFKREKEKIITRVGINTGPVAIQGEDLFGDAVNVASRMETKATPGGVLVSESTFKQINNYVTYEDMGPITVKGKDKPIHAYHLLSVSASLPQNLDPLVSGDSGLKSSINIIQTDAKSEIEKIKALITLDGTDKSNLTKKLLLHYRILYKAVSEIKEPEIKEKISSMLVTQWQDLKSQYLNKDTH